MFALFAAMLGGVAALQRAIIAQANLDTLHLGPLVESIDRAGINTNTHGCTAFFSSFDDLLQRGTTVDEIAGVDTNFIDALTNGFEGEISIIVNVGHQRDAN